MCDNDTTPGSPVCGSNPLTIGPVEPGSGPPTCDDGFATTIDDQCVEGDCVGTGKVVWIKLSI